MRVYQRSAGRWVGLGEGKHSQKNQSVSSTYSLLPLSLSKPRDPRLTRHGHWRGCWQADP